MRLAELLWERIRSIGWTAPAGGPPPPAEPRSPRKLLPVIDRDYCSGCRACVDACDNGCIGLVWDFATLERAEDCASDGACAGACPEGLIRMEWIACDARPTAGRWEEPAPQTR